jgi:hypothetical protein
VADNVVGACMSYMWAELEGTQQRSVVEDLLLTKVTTAVAASNKSLTQKGAVKTALRSIADHSGDVDKVGDLPPRQLASMSMSTEDWRPSNHG